MELPEEIKRSRDGRMISLEGYDSPVPYWDDPRVHNFGNNHPISAIASPIATKLIDMAAYDGVDLRRQIIRDIVTDSKEWTNTFCQSKSIVDLCCGCGASTAKWGTGVDTSSSFLNMASLKGIFNRKQNFVKGNAETWGESNSFDVVTCMFATHEMPRKARLNVLRNAKRIARKRVVFVDIDTDYVPSEAMLSGEPYVLEYQRNVDKDWRM